MSRLADQKAKRLTRAEQPLQPEYYLASRYGFLILWRTSEIMTNTSDTVFASVALMPLTIFVCLATANMSGLKIS
jgi:hypothetical protein